jgi:pilus assembly protein CpaC
MTREATVKYLNCTSVAKRMFAVFFVFAISSLIAPAEDLVVPKGSSKRIPVPEGIRKVTVGNPNVIETKPTDDGRALIVHGMGLGASDLVIERLQGTPLVYTVIVREDLAQLQEQVRQLLADVEGLEIATVGDKIVLKGNIITKSGYDKVAQITAAYSGALLNMTTFDRREMNKYVEAAILQDIGLEGITAKVTEDTVILEGVVYSEAEKERAAEIARLKVPNVRNLLRVQEVLIETDVQFVEVTTDAASDIGYNILKNLGVSAQGSFSGATSGKPSGSWGITGTASAKINALVSSGRGRVLVQKNITAKSGSEGRAMVGGEIGIPVAGNVGGSLEKIQFGVILRVKPALQGRDNIVSDVSVEVSMPVAAGGNAYALSKNETATTVICRVGESVILSGLVQTLGNFSKEKTPVLGDIPLLNLFFSQKTSTKIKKEVVIFLTPHVLVPEAVQAGAFSEERKRLRETSDDIK